MSNYKSKNLTQVLEGGTVTATIANQEGQDILMLSTAENPRKIEQLILAGTEIDELYELLKDWKGE